MSHFMPRLVCQDAASPPTTQSGGDVVLASGTQPETKNSRTQVVPATGNRATGYQASEMNLQSPNVNASSAECS